MISHRVERSSVSLAASTSRRSFLGKLGQGFVALVGGPFVAIALRPDRAEAHHICGHTFTTGSCPHPFSPHTRVDRFGFPVHPRWGFPVDNQGRMYSSRRQRRNRVCKVLVPRHYPRVNNPEYGGGWSRCCGGRIRRIRDCCAYVSQRINGDRAVRGYCHGGRNVFCITYVDTNTRC
jgi:hypothetical protein